LGSPYQYPWVNFNSSPTTAVDSTPLILFGAANNSIVDSIFVCNTSGREIFVNLYLLTERDPPTAINTFIEFNLQILKDQKIELIKGSVLNMQAGDLMYGYSDFSGNTFDCIVSYRQLLEESE